MTTMGLRGIFACAFIVSTGLLTGMAAMPSGAAAGELQVSDTAAPSAQNAGVFALVKRKACEVSLAVTRSDRAASRDRSRQCGP